MVLSCGSDAELKFEKITSRLDAYLTKQPVLLTSNKTIKDNQDIYAYFALKIIGYELSHDVSRTFSKTISRKAFVEISCEVKENSKNGDVVSNITELKMSHLNNYRESSGFSTTDLALLNSDFSHDSQKLTIRVTYFYQNDYWHYNDLAVSSTSAYFTQDLENFPQNKAFREAIGMVDKTRG
jgi:hypothetical protein